MLGGVMLGGIADREAALGRLRFQKLRKDREVFLLSQIVADECGVCLTRLLRRSRGSGRAARARQIAIYLSHVSLSRPQDVVAELFSRERSTIAHAVQTMEDQRDDPAIDALLNRIEERVTRATHRREFNHAA